ncbi:type IV pilus modification protein PilV [Marinobacter sp. X15-166B]|uniref:type IV pilus modification protein PilV n=1 Tax=Marinobacter sp. X15-166B TaxID=1897620 RepID=UPI00085CCF46|nr:type IV pilus modification protein PilV [Marinobacter sp. X15-166B]OEY66659.1 type IV pilus modification protein PilV [Marinobacter sp. X15-166B]
MNSIHWQGRRQASGIALIEVLVAVLVLGIGLLGMAAMQVQSSQMTNGAEQRTQAILLTADMMDRIRANRGNRADYDGVAVDPDATDCATDYAPAGGATVSANDITEWSNLVVCLLPEGTGTVEVDNATGEVTVTIDWTKADADGVAVTLRTVI